MSKYGPAPTRLEWGDLDIDPELQSGYDHFGGMTVEEARPLFAENPIEAAAEIRFAPARVWNYYIFCFAEHLTSPNSKGDADAASTFLRLVRDRAKEHPHQLKGIWEALQPVIAAVSGRQSFYEASEEIYGSFPDLRRETEETVSRSLF